MYMYMYIFPLCVSCFQIRLWQVAATFRWVSVLNKQRGCDSTEWQCKIPWIEFIQTAFLSLKGILNVVFNIGFSTSRSWSFFLYLSVNIRISDSNFVFSFQFKCNLSYWVKKSILFLCQNLSPLFVCFIHVRHSLSSYAIFVTRHPLRSLIESAPFETPLYLI